MKIIDAYWEENNLGLKSYEIILTQDDDINEFLLKEKQLRADGAGYIVAKVPVNVGTFLFELPKAGYIFMEASFDLSLRKQNYVCPNYVERFDRNMSVKEIASPSDADRIYTEISKNIFDNDRIALDKALGKKIANTRYINWIKSLVAKGEPIYEVYSGDKPIGFFILEHMDKDKVRGILTGLYTDYAASGYGALIMKKLYDTVWAAGYKMYYAKVVSNNIKAIRANLLFGSVLDNISYHYVKK